MTQVIATLLLGFLLTSVFLCLVFLVKRRGLLDQVLVINALGMIAVGIITAIGLLLSQDYFVDIALLYALINFVASMALLRLFNKNNATWLDFFKEYRP